MKIKDQIIICVLMLIIAILALYKIDKVSRRNTVEIVKPPVDAITILEVELPSERNYKLPEIEEEVEEVIIIDEPVVEEVVTESKVYTQEIYDGQYTTVTYVWNYLKDAGYNDYVVAGIIGNMMAETGGQTLNLNWEAWSEGSYYGICQWSKKFFPEVIGQNLEGQLEFLLSNIKYEIDTFGYAYSSGFDFDSFLRLEDEREAALVFAKCYERCNSDYYSIRQDNATKAYEYFGR